MSIVANNRFLMRVNPEIKRALTDGGSSLEHPEIQQLMRQMVDLGIADNLKLWVHNGLVKTRTSGSDLYVPKAYDISGEEDDAAQATEANQPKLVSLGMEFDGSDDYLNLGDTFSANHLDGAGAVSITTWAQSKVSKTNNIIVGSGIHYLNNGVWLAFRDKNIRIGGRSSSFSTFVSLISNDEYDLNTWYHITGIYDYLGKQLLLYVNGTFRDSITNISLIDWPENAWTQGDDGPTRIGLTPLIDLDRSFDGTINDIRIFNKALSATEIAAIYNQSKGFYGIT